MPGNRALYDRAMEQSREAARQKMLNTASELVPGAVKSAAHGALDSVTQGAASLREQASALVFGTPPPPMPGTFPKASEAGPFDR